MLGPWMNTEWQRLVLGTTCMKTQIHLSFCRVYVSMCAEDSTQSLVHARQEALVYKDLLCVCKYFAWMCVCVHSCVPGALNRDKVKWFTVNVNYICHLCRQRAPLSHISKELLYRTCYSWAKVLGRPLIVSCPVIKGKWYQFPEALGVSLVRMPQNTKLRCHCSVIQHFLSNIQGPCACVWAEAKGWLIFLLCGSPL